VLKNIKIVLLLTTVLIFTGCIKDKEESNSPGITVLEEGKITSIFSKQNIMGIEISLQGKIDESKISIKNDKIKIVYYDGEKTNIAVAAKNGKIYANEEIIKVEEITVEKVEVIKFVKEISFKTETGNIKENILLGDYNKNNSVELNDFMLFAQNYGGNSKEFDISPAQKGTGDASEIYSKNYGDGVVNLEDLVVFATNFGKTAPIDKIDIISESKTIKAGKTLQLIAKSYLNGEEKETDVVWENEGENSSIKIDSTGKITGVTAGNAVVNATAFGIKGTINITVEEIEYGEYYNDGNYVAYVKNQSDETKAINIIVMGDGYIKEDLKKEGSYEREAKKIIDGIFEYAPFSQYKEYFNAYIIFCESKDSGSDYTQTADNKDTVFNSNYGQNGIDRLLVIKNYSKVNEYIKNAGLTSKNGLQKNIMIISVNDEKYGGSGGIYSVVSKNSFAVDIAAHEIGHSFGGLADEYSTGETFPKANAAFQKNVDLTDDLKKIKWSHFIGIDGYSNVGAYEGAFYYTKGVWRPTENCLMKSLGEEFCPVCREEIVKVIHSCVRKEYLFTEFIKNDKINLNGLFKNSRKNINYPEMFPDDLRIME
jgi:hypothetical protein